MKHINDDYQAFVDNGSFYAHVNYRDAGEFSYVALGLAGEAGETADEIKKIVRVSSYFNEVLFRQEFAKRGIKVLDETSDILWYLTRMCTLLGITLNELMIYNTVKLYNRHYPKGTDKSIPWPLENISYEGATKLVQRIEQGITDLICLENRI